MIEPVRKGLSLTEAVEWLLRALKEEGLSVLLCGKSALDFQGERTGSADIDLAVGIDFSDVVSTLDEYERRGDLHTVGSGRGVVSFVVGGKVTVDVLDVRTIHPLLFPLLEKEGSTDIPMGSAGDVRAVTREGYFVLAVMIGRKGFASEKRDPMRKVRQAWALFGARTDRKRVDGLLGRLDARGGLDEALDTEGHGED